MNLNCILAHLSITQFDTIKSNELLLKTVVVYTKILSNLLNLPSENPQLYFNCIPGIKGKDLTFLQLFYLLARVEE